jgi:hypothetical protein
MFSDTEKRKKAVLDVEGQQPSIPVGSVSPIRFNPTNPILFIQTTQGVHVT